MKTSYKKDLKQAYLIVDGDETSPEDYQVAMLRENDIPGILKLEVRSVDNQNRYYYDITGKTSLRTFHEKVNLTYEDMKRLVTDILAVTRELPFYMLDGNRLLLEPEYIFSDKKGYYFCYYPAMAGREGSASARPVAKDSFHRLTEFFVREVNYRDEEGVRFAYTLHKATMEENYSIEQILKEMEVEETPEEQEEEELPVCVNYTQRMEELSEIDSLVEERNHFWDPLRKLLQKTRKMHLQDPIEDL